MTASFRPCLFSGSLVCLFWWAQQSLMCVCVCLFAYYSHAENVSCVIRLEMASLGCRNF